MAATTKKGPAKKAKATKGKPVAKAAKPKATAPLAGGLGRTAKAAAKGKAR